MRHHLADDPWYTIVGGSSPPDGPKGGSLGAHDQAQWESRVDGPVENEEEDRVLTPAAEPVLTIGVPVYNGERFLADALESLLAQDFTDFRLIVSDNASTDTTGQIAASFAARDPRVSVVTHEVNIGGPGNFTSLVALATTPFFKWAAADDLCAPTFVSRCMQALGEHPEAVLAYPRTVLIDEHGTPIADYDDQLHTVDPDPVVRIRHYALRRGLSNPAFAVIRTEPLRRTSLMQPKVSSDITMLAELILQGGFVNVDEPLFYRRKVSTSAGLGTLNRTQLQHWYRPGSRPSLVSPMLRASWDIERSIARSDLPPAARLRVGAAYAAARTERRLRTRASLARRRIRTRLQPHTAP